MEQHTEQQHAKQNTASEQSEKAEHMLITGAYVHNLSKQLNEPEWLMESRMRGLSRLQSAGTIFLQTRLPVKDITALLENIKSGKSYKSDKLDKSGKDATNKPTKISYQHKSYIHEHVHEIVNELALSLDNASIGATDDSINQANSKIKQILSSDIVCENKMLERKEARTIDEINSLIQCLWNSGTAIIIPENKTLEEPIVVEENGVISRIVLIFGKNSEASVVIKSNQHYPNFLRIDAICMEDARAKILLLKSSPAESFETIKVEALQNVSMQIASAAVGSNWCRTEVMLNGAESTAEIKEAFFATKNDKVEISTEAFHNAPNTTSIIKGNGAVAGAAKSMYRGLVKIDKYAENSDGKQKADMLILSPNAEANAVPRLVTDNNNVKCAHGATISRLDVDTIFYIMTRGMKQHEATALMLSGFYNEILQALPEIQRSMASDTLDSALRVEQLM